MEKEKLSTIKSKVQVYEFYDDGNNVYWQSGQTIYYLPSQRFYELKAYLERHFNQPYYQNKYSELERKELVRNNLTLSAYILEEEPKYQVETIIIQGVPVWKIVGDDFPEEPEEFYKLRKRTLEQFSQREEDLEEESNPKLKKILDYAKKMVEKLRRGEKV